MENIFKPFVGWVINLKNNTFFRAKLKLTFFYAVILLIIIVIFSSLIYILFVNNIINSNEFEEESYSGLNNIKELQILNNAIDRLKLTLITADVGIFIVVIIAGYFLSTKTLQPVKNSLEEQKRFVSDSAHELRTPLSIMKTGIETVSAEKRQSLKEYQNLSKDLLEEINKLITISNDLLFLSKKDSAAFLKEHVKLNISLICKKQINLFKPYADKKSVFLESDIKGQYYFKGNYEQINQLVTNLLKNAIDYNRQEGKVLLSLQKEKNNIILKVTDTGIGISEEDLKYIYKRFYKADKSRSISDSGAGLGLSIAKEIVELHNGTIKINSVLNKGTEVAVMLPAL